MVLPFRTSGEDGIYRWTKTVQPQLKVIHNPQPIEFMKKLLFIFPLAALLCGCASLQQAPQNHQIVWGGPDDYGDYPTNSEELVKLGIRSFFKDPDSVKDLTIMTPSKYTLSVLPDSFTELVLQTSGRPKYTQIYCYLISFMCNAKNSFGGYAGIQTTSIVVRDGHILDHF
jgi:hypothetical protein